MNKIRYLSGIFTIIGSLILFGFAIYYYWIEAISDYYWTDTGEKKIMALIIITAICALYYAASGLLGGRLWSQTRELKLNNRILNLKIEQKRLKSELGESKTGPDKEA